MEWTFEDAEATLGKFPGFSGVGGTQEIYLYILGRHYDNGVWGLKLVQYDEDHIAQNDWVSETLKDQFDVSPRGVIAGLGTGWPAHLNRGHGKVDAGITGRELTSSGGYRWKTYKFHSRPEAIPTDPKPPLWQHTLSEIGALDSPMGITMWTRLVDGVPNPPDYRHNAFITGLRANGSNGYDLLTIRIEENWYP